MSAAASFRARPHTYRSPWSTTEEVARAQRGLARWVHNQFRRKLSFEDCCDVAADAIITLDELLRAVEPVRNPDRLLRRIARHRALDAVRRLEGEAQQGPRKPVVPFECSTIAMAGSEEPVGAVDDATAFVQAYADLAAALDELPEDERTLLLLRHVDGLPAGTCAGLLGLSLPRYERRHTRAMILLREALAASARDESCTTTRTLTDREPLSTLEALRRDAHLTGCLPCSAYARAQRERRFQAPGAGFCGTDADFAPHAA